MRHGLSLSRERWFYPNGKDWGKGALAISGTTRR